MILASASSRMPVSYEYVEARACVRPGVAGRLRTRPAVMSALIASLRAALRREMTPRNKAGAILAVLTCPCHVVMVVFLLAGTAVGTWLAAVRAYLIMAFALLFLFGLYFMIRPDPKACATDACRIDTPDSGK